MNPSEHIPVLDSTSENFEEELKFNIWSTQSSSDYDNSRDRPYNGQPWTDDGERGKQEVSGVTLRDLKDCLIKAMLLSSASDVYLNNFDKCWNFSDKENPKPTPYLLNLQNDPDYIYTKVETGNWRPQDVYKINWDNIDPLAIIQNFSVEVEKLMGIFPNVQTLNYFQEI